MYATMRASVTPAASHSAVMKRMASPCATVIVVRSALHIAESRLSVTFSLNIGIFICKCMRKLSQTKKALHLRKRRGSPTLHSFVLLAQCRTSLSWHSDGEATKVQKKKKLGLPCFYTTNTPPGYRGLFLASTAFQRHLFYFDHMGEKIICQTTGFDTCTIGTVIFLIQLQKPILALGLSPKLPGKKPVIYYDISTSQRPGNPQSFRHV